MSEAMERDRWAALRTDVTKADLVDFSRVMIGRVQGRAGAIARR
jgi:hypothetical protein